MVHFQAYVLSEQQQYFRFGSRIQMKELRNSVLSKQQWSCDMLFAKQCSLTMKRSFFHREALYLAANL